MALIQKKRIRNKEERQRAQKRYYEKTKESRREIRLLATKKWVEKNPNYHKEYRKKNKGLVNAKTWRYKTAKLNAFPKWLTKEQKDKITEIYKNCPQGYEVDHIVPLQGKEVKGLHVPWNLQYLEKSANKRKNNKWL